MRLQRAVHDGSRQATKYDGLAYNSLCGSRQAGKADLDGNGVITASELGAYVSPIVASFSKQTPAMGNLIGSEGGEFIFELQPEALTSMTPQFEGRAVELNQRLQQSVQAEILKTAARGTEPAKTGPAVAPRSPKAPEVRQILTTL